MQGKPNCSNPNRTMEGRDKLLLVLALSVSGYEYEVMRCYMSWCEDRAHRAAVDALPLLKSRELWRWYRREWETVEIDFLKRYGDRLLSLSLQQKHMPAWREGFWALSERIKEVYPKVLLREVLQKAAPSPPATPLRDGDSAAEWSWGRGEYQTTGTL